MDQHIESVVNIGKNIGGSINIIPSNARPIVFDIRSSTTLCRELAAEEFSDK
jgi:hypothetical protein